MSEIGRRLDVDRKTVRYWAQPSEWKPYERDRAAMTLLSKHEQFLRERAAQVHYSARILYQEPKHQRGYPGSYDTVKLFAGHARTNAEPAIRPLGVSL